LVLVGVSLVLRMHDISAGCGLCLCCSIVGMYVCMCVCVRVCMVGVQSGMQCTESFFPLGSA
jgi:hypothetical protein